MTFRFCDGMDSYAVTANLSIRWTTVTGTNLSTTGGRFGAGAVTNSGSNPYTMQMVKSLSIPSGAKVRIGMSIKFGTGSSPYGVSASYPIVAMNSNHVLGMSTSGQLVVTTFGSSTAQITSTATIIDNSYHWVELEYYLAGASSTAQLYIDGILQGSVTANLGAATAITTMTFGGGYVFGGTGWLDDIVIWDDQGASFNTFPLGPRRISTLVPNADGDLAQFTPKTGTAHYPMVNGGYTSGNYVNDAGTGNIDLYKFPPLSYTPVDVSAVVGNYYGQNSGSGTTSLIPKLKTGTTTVSGTTLTLPVGALALFQAPFTTDASGTAWTASTVNAMQLGMGD
jgi:hypothetical protein